MQKLAIRAYQKKWIRPFFYPFQKAITGKKWVFIVGCYNSGTTLLNHIVGFHPEITSLPTEGTILTAGLTRPEDFGWPRMWHMCENAIILDEKSTKPDPDRVKKHWSFWYDKEKKIYLEKSIANSAKIKWLEKNFDSPYFVWIIRNGYCVAEGIRRRSKSIDRNDFKYQGIGYPLGMCARQWIVNNDVIEKDSKNVKHLMKIKYEDLMENFEPTIDKLFEWLPVERKKNIKLSKIADFSFHNETKPIKNMNSISLSGLSKEDIAQINTVAEKYLSKWGYEIL